MAPMNIRGKWVVCEITSRLASRLLGSPSEVGRQEKKNQMNTLCFASNLTSAEWAAWVQAVGSILAILGAVSIAVWQAGRQHRNALAVHATEQRSAKSELAKTLSALAENCSKAMVFLNRQMNSREAVYEAAEGHKHFDVGQLERLDGALASIPLQSLPSTLVTPTMILGATIRQYREKIEQVLRVHRTMDADNFADFFGTLDEMATSLAATCKDIANEAERVAAHS